MKNVRSIFLNKHPDLEIQYNELNKVSVYFLSDRNGDWVDGLANALGALAGFVYLNNKSRNLLSH